MNSIITFYTLISVILVSLISLIGLISISLSSMFGRKALMFLISFAAGAMLGNVFIHLLPELSAEGNLNFVSSLYILGGIIFFYILEKYIHWHHHHGEGLEQEHATHPMAFLNLFGDGIHNLIDGMIIAGAYLIDIKLGIATTIAVLVHEIPQEIGDFGVLIYSGLSKIKAIVYNLLSALISVVGAIIVLSFGASEKITTLLISLAIGSFIYLSLADLLPETHKEKENYISQLLVFLLGIGVMFGLLLIG